MMNKCNQCNGIGNVHQIRSAFEPRPFFVQCANCKRTTGRYATKAEAIEEWNKMGKLSFTFFVIQYTDTQGVWKCIWLDRKSCEDALNTLFDEEARKHLRIVKMKAAEE